MKTIAPLALAAALAGPLSAAPALEQRVAELEKQVAELKASIAPLLEQQNARAAVEAQRAKARERMRKDLDVYSRDDLRAIESLYQVANKNWKTKEGKDSLQKLVTTYDKANRTGCALLYLGQMSEGDDSINYLKKAISDFSDCYYGDGVQVGAYARLILADRYQQQGDKQASDDLIGEIKAQFPDAIDHKGRPLSSIMR